MKRKKDNLIRVKLSHTQIVTLSDRINTWQKPTATTPNRHNNTNINKQHKAKLVDNMI